MKNLIPKRVMEYIIITFAVVLMDVGIYVFKFPNNFSFGGVSGMAVVFSHFIPMTSAQINLVINLILLVIGFIVLGRDFGVKTAYVTVVSSLLLNVFEKVFPMDRALTGNIMLELCFAIILPAVAAALLFFENASGGGTDIVAMIIKKYSTMNISGALFAVDCVIVVVSFMVFDLTTGLCSVLGLMAKTLLIDKSIERMKLNKYFTIISSKPDYIRVHESELGAHRFNMNVDLAGQLIGGNVLGVTGEASVCDKLLEIADGAGIGASVKNQIWGSDSNSFAWKGIPAMTLNRDGFGMHTRYDTIDLLSAWSLERSAILLGCIADELGNAEVFPFERKMPEKFIGELDEYMCR